MTFGEARQTAEFVKKAKEIAIEIGRGYQEEDADEPYKAEFEFDEMKIIWDSRYSKNNSYYNTENRLFIYIKGYEVLNINLSYLSSLQSGRDIDSQNFKIVNGKWQELVNQLYEQIPDIKENIKNKRYLRYEKMRRIEKLRKYFNFIEKVQIENEHFIKMIVRELEKKGIFLTYREWAGKPTDYIVVDHKDNIDGFFGYGIMYNNQPSFEILESRLSHLDTEEYFLDKFILNGWDDVFIKEMDILYNYYINNVIDFKVDESLLKLQNKKRN